MYYYEEIWFSNVISFHYYDRLVHHHKLREKKERMNQVLY